MPALNVDRAALDAYIAAAKADYVAWWGARKDEDSVKAMIEEFDITYEVGNTYIKVVESRHGAHRSVHSFIVNKATKKFPVGTILKAASWKAPATNFARGNVNYPASYADRVRWTGIM